MSAPFQYTPQTPHPPQRLPPPQTPLVLNRRQPRFDPDSYARGTGPRRPQPRPPTPFSRDAPLPDTPYAPTTPLYHPQQQPYYTPGPFSPWAPVIPPDYDDDSENDKEPESPLGKPPGPNNLQPKPDYWRYEYPNKRMQCPLRGLKLFSRNNNVRLNALLYYKPKKAPPMRYDLCVLPSQDYQFVLPGSHHRRPTARDMRQFATDPPVRELRLWHHLLPWYIDIVATGDNNAITVGALLEQLHLDLRRRITPYDYWTTALPPHKRERLDVVCSWRVATRGPSEDPAICHLDFLDKEFLFIGMIPCPNGTFEFRTVPVA